MFDALVLTPGSVRVEIGRAILIAAHRPQSISTREVVDAQPGDLAIATRNGMDTHKFTMGNGRGDQHFLTKRSQISVLVNAIQVCDVIGDSIEQDRAFTKDLAEWDAKMIAKRHVGLDVAIRRRASKSTRNLGKDPAEEEFLPTEYDPVVQRPALRMTRHPCLRGCVPL